MSVSGPVLILDQGEVLGGAQLHALEVARLLAGRGWEVRVLAGESSHPAYRRRVLDEADLELELVRMPRLQPMGARTLWRTAATATRIRRTLRARGAALLHANTLRAQVAGTLAAAGTGIPVVWTVHDFLFPPKLLSLLLPLVDRVIAVSESVAGFLGDAAPPSQAAKIVVIPNGIDLDRVRRTTPAETVRDASGEEFRFLEDRRYVGIVGHVHPRKGQDTFLWAAATLLDRLSADCPVEFVVVGGVIEHEPESAAFLPALRESCRELGIASRVRFLGWQDDVIGIVKRLDLLVSASRIPEGLGRTILEGFAAGVPVVASPLGEPGRMIRHGRNGLLFEPDDPASLATAMESVLSDAALAERLRAGGGATVDDRFSLDAVTSETEEVWRAVMTAGP